MEANERQPRDTSTPTLLIVSLGGMLVAVIGVVVLGQLSTTAVLIAAYVVLLAGTGIVTRTIGRQLDDGDGTGSRRRQRDGDRSLSGRWGHDRICGSLRSVDAPLDAAPHSRAHLG